MDDLIKSKEMKEILANIRAVLISTKGKMNLRTLDRDYEMLVGERLPYRKNGFATLEDFIVSLPELSFTSGPAGELLIDAIPTDKVQHIVSLVNRQRSSKKKPARKPNLLKNWKVPKQFQSFPNRKYNPRMTAPRFRRETAAPKIIPPKLTIIPPPPPPTTTTISRTVPIVSTSSTTSTTTTTASRAINLIESDVSGSTRPRMRILNTPSVPVPRSLSVTFMNPLASSAIRLPAPVSRLGRSVSFDDSPPPPQPQLPAITAPADSSPKGPYLELLTFIHKYHLPEPVIKVTSRAVSKNSKKQLFDCLIRIDQHLLYSSYPRDCVTMEEAKSEAARLALGNLAERYGRPRHRLPVATEHDILNRVPDLIRKHFHGIWDTQIARNYEELYKEQLPYNWLSIIDRIPIISVDLTIENRFVLRYDDFSYVSDSNCLNLDPDVSIPLNCTGEEIAETDAEIFWDLLVTCATSTVEIWCQRIDTSEHCFEELDLYYRNCKPEHVSRVDIGGSYAVRYEETWYRVRVLKMIEHNVLCFFVDYGDECLIPRSDVYVLPGKYASERAQAFLCRLTGLEELSNLSCAREHVQQLNNNNYLSNVTSNSESDELTSISLVLYEPDGTLNVNQHLINLIVKDSCVTKLELNEIKRARVTHAQPNGDVYVQVQSEGCDKILELLGHYDQPEFEFDLSEMVLANALEQWNEDNRKLFLVLNQNFMNNNNNNGDGDKQKGGRFLRCVIKERSPCGDYAQIYYVDYGFTDIIRLRNAGAQRLYPLDEISDVLSVYPHQAIRIRLGIDPLPANFVSRIRKLAPSDADVLCKTIRYERQDDDSLLPICELFQREEKGLFTINASLWYTDIENMTQSATSPTSDTMKLSSQFENLKLDKTANRSPVPSTGILKAPTLPTIKSYFDVRVPVAVSPWNFFIQPYDSARQLKELMSEMQTHYNKTAQPVHVGDVVPGHIYASKRNDGLWYRTSVMKVINAGSISVFYCDFGCYQNVSVIQLFRLDRRFLELPYQAIKARLSGVQPKDGTWLMDDCKYFENLVLRKTFVSILCAIENDELHKSDLVLTLQLYDTSSRNDLRIDQLLIQKKIAVAADV